MANFYDVRDKEGKLYVGGDPGFAIPFMATKSLAQAISILPAEDVGRGRRLLGQERFKPRLQRKRATDLHESFQRRPSAVVFQPFDDALRQPGPGRKFLLGHPLAFTKLLYQCTCNVVVHIPLHTDNRVADWHSYGNLRFVDKSDSLP